jgi:hypothetical protein
MLSTKTVMILGAGASMPYGFPSGRELLQDARRKTLADLVTACSPAPRGHAEELHLALRHTLDLSIDGMLETMPPTVVGAGKTLMARLLLQLESRLRDRSDEHDGDWYRIHLWPIFDFRSLEAFRATPLTIVTYNYDRSLEYSLVNALSVKLRAPLSECAAALDCIGPIHLHGELGTLPKFPHLAGTPVPFGGASSRPTDSECRIAAEAIRIVHEPNPTDEAFMRARDALSAADRVIFLGFGYAPTNFERLQMEKCVRRTTTTFFLCVRGFTPKQQIALVRPFFNPWIRELQVGTEEWDILQFFRNFPEALL